MIHTLDHKNNASIGFPMSENLGIYTLIIHSDKTLLLNLVKSTDTGYIGEDTGILDFHI